MKAVQYLGNHQIGVREISDPVCESHEVIIRPLAVGICGTDIHILEGTYPSNPPVTIGHEVAGEVVEKGVDVTNVSIGDLVTVEPHKYCGVCIYCQIGYVHMCISKQAYGVHLPGGMAEYQSIPAMIAYKIPEGISAKYGALTEPLACCVHAMDRLDPLSGLPILIIGSGPAGALLISLAKLRGLAPIVAVDTRADRRALALAMGADEVYSSIQEARVASERAQRPDEFPYVVDAVGSAEILAEAIELVARRGTILVFGVAHPEARWSVKPNDIYAKELTIIGSAINPFTHKRAVGLLNRLPLDKLRIESFHFDDVEKAFEAHRAGQFDKVQLNPGLKNV